jgi:hypothetical protein
VKLRGTAAHPFAEGPSFLILSDIFLVCSGVRQIGSW